jgi:formylglycine-generating enzyme required for sulfatase activity
MLKLFQRFIIFFSVNFLFFSYTLNLSESNIDSDLMELGNTAFAAERYETAEKIFNKVLEVQPGNYLATRDLAKVKIKLNKLNQALSLLNDILKLPVAKGRDILVYTKGDPEPKNAELVDETVMVIDKSIKQNNDEFSKFLKEETVEPVPHYRVYFKETGKMKLLPKNKNIIKYFGIPAATREKIMSLKSQVKKKIISSLNVIPKEEMVTIQGGCFQMGSNAGDPDELPVHEVCISSFKLGKHEVNQKKFQSIMGVNPSENVGADHPVDSANWLDARDYCQKLGLRLPSEAEWEYAARGGTQTEFYWGNKMSGKEANFCDSTCDLNNREPNIKDGFKNSAPVGSFPPNAFGLYDMAGNVSEWVLDWMAISENYYVMGPEKDPQGPRPELDTCSGVDCVGAFSITQKVYRGGAWNQGIFSMRSANRKDAHFQLKADGTGFRCAGDLKPE